MGLESPKVNATVSGTTTATAVNADDLEVDSGTLSVDADNNRVGINTESPAKTLSVDGDMHFQPTATSTAHVTTAGSLKIQATNNIRIGDDGADSIRLGRTNSTACKIHLRSGTDNDVVVSNSKVGIGTDSPKTALTVEGAVTLKEQAAAETDTAAYGQLWVKTATPNELYFTTDAGDDVQITSGTGLVSGTISGAQTGITSVVNASLEIGRDADNRIKFGTDNQIIFEVDGGDNVIFKGSGEIEATSLDISGDADIDGTLEADAITVDGTTLAEYISDTVGAMVSSNTETGITVTYQDADNTIDFALDQVTSLGTITQDTVTFTSANSEDPLVQIKNTTNDANGARLQLVKDKGAAASDNDIVGMIEFVGDNDAQEQTILARVQTEVADASDGAEGGRLMLGVATHDAEIQFGLVLEDGDAEDEIDAIIGNGDNSVTTAAGYMKANNGFLVPEQKSLHIEAPMLATADHTATGITALMVASENIAQGDLVCVSGNGTIGKADADAVATMPAIGLAVAAISSSNAGVVLLRGMFRDDTYNFTAGNRLFVHTDGTVTATAPSGNGDVAQAVGVALSDDVIYFSPDMTLVEITA